MTIRQFIEKAVAGGWKPLYARQNENWRSDHQKIAYIERYHLDSLLLDPVAWQAVGRVEGWLNETGKFCGKAECGNGGYHAHGEGRIEWKENMHRMVDALAEGKSLEEFISTL